MTPPGSSVVLFSHVIRMPGDDLTVPAMYEGKFTRNELIKMKKAFKDFDADGSGEVIPTYVYPIFLSEPCAHLTHTVL